MTQSVINLLIKPQEGSEFNSQNRKADDRCWAATLPSADPVLKNNLQLACLPVWVCPCSTRSSGLSGFCFLVSHVTKLTIKK